MRIIRVLAVLFFLSLPGLPALVFGPWQLGALWLFIVAGAGLKARVWEDMREVPE